jgi:hypothetical protein
LDGIKKESPNYANQRERFSGQQVIEEKVGYILSSRFGAGNRFARLLHVDYRRFWIIETSKLLRGIRVWAILVPTQFVNATSS